MDQSPMSITAGSDVTAGSVRFNEGLLPTRLDQFFNITQALDGS